ncbi:site-specific integrase [Streptomyces sp. ITFR-6]|uniref:site-specific integrase n=1 Tax=Streptomyces sp. ITFR-6 TaxID=3075197 RepID=UPI0028898F38|nr:site-specific integrase [Streptomyces sp. ITFR-6]WNI28469.1 site-specific integrase [Streptomyces sp. ITFR-6]
MTTATSPLFDGRSAIFAGADVCREAGLTLPGGVGRPVFEDDVWDFTDVVGLPVQMGLSMRQFNFVTITDLRWQLVAKELVLAMLVPRHPAVAPLPRAYRTALHLLSCRARLDELERLLSWLTARGVISLERIDTQICEAYMAHRRYVLDEHGAVVGEQSHGTRRQAAQIIVDLVNYRELFTADRVPANLRPWGGATASAVAEMPSGRTQNKTPPVADDVLQPMLAAALFLVSSLGPHAVELARQIRETDHLSTRRATGLRNSGPAPVAEFTALLNEYTDTYTPLPMLAEHHIADRLADGWSPGDPLLPVATGVLARQAGDRQFWTRWMPALRGPLEDAVAAVGVKEVFARDVAETTTANDSSVLPWTLPLHRLQAVALVGVVRTAAITVLAAVSGMRASELMELRIGCRKPPEEPVPGLHRYRLASKIVKGQPLGGTDDEWVVIEPVYRAVELAEDLHDDPKDGALLFGRFAFTVRYQWFRNWVNSPDGQRLGLTEIPDGQVNLRMLRRTLALELAYRPGGVLASKIHLKHVVVATTEGYASRPGGAQAELLAEVNKHESDRNLDLVLAEFRNYQQGILPAGPGARSLTEFFSSIDEKLEAAASAPKTQHSDRDVLNLLTKRAKVLHLGPANYCWFTDPSRALCLKLAGTPTADRPLIGMCDSARCPQATHHSCHRPVWAEHAERTETFIGQLGITRKTERTRLQVDYDRALRVVAEIDTATAHEEPS